jgi:hypothetical protein
MTGEGNDGRGIVFATSQEPDVGAEFGTLNHAAIMKLSARAIAARDARRRRNAAAIRQIWAATVELQAAMTALEEEFAQLRGRIEAAVRDATAGVVAEHLARRNREG